MKLRLRPAAVEDIGAARENDADADRGLTENLAEDLDRFFALLEAFPRSAPLVEGYESVRRGVLRRFPYAVFYGFTEPDRIAVLRVVTPRGHQQRGRVSRPDPSNRALPDAPRVAVL